MPYYVEAMTNEFKVYRRSEIVPTVREAQWIIEQANADGAFPNAVLWVRCTMLKTPQWPCDSRFRRPSMDTGGPFGTGSSCPHAGESTRRQPQVPYSRSARKVVDKFLDSSPSTAESPFQTSDDET